MFSEIIYKMQHALNRFTFKKHADRLIDKDAFFVYDYDIVDWENIGNEIYDMIDLYNHLEPRNKNAIAYCNAAINELVELKVALGEKFWAKKVTNMKNVKEEGDAINHIKEEYIDVLHFVMSIGHCLGMTPQEMIREYEKKNKVNYDRQIQGY